MFYDRIKQVCANNGFVMTHLLRELDMASSNIGKWKKGGTPSPKVLNALSERLDVSVDYLLEKTDDPTPASKKKAAPEGEQPFDDETVEAAKQFMVLSPESRARVFGYLASLNEQENS